MLAQTSPFNFWKPIPDAAEKREAAWRAGVAAYCRADDEARLAMLADIVTRMPSKQENRPMIGAFLRLAWTSEAYVDGTRRGNEFTALERRLDIRIDLDALFERYADGIMTADEREHLAGLPEEFTIYIGGVDDPGTLLGGRAWTTSEEIAWFFATTWPQRWGLPGEPAVVSVTIGRQDTLAFIDERQEQEIVLRDPGRFADPALLDEG